MSRELRDRQLQRFCDVLAAVRPDAPTYCAGWDAHDLAVHVWQLKRDPLSWPGVAIPALAGYAARRAAQVKRRWGYAELIAGLRAEPGEIACMPGDRFEDYRHALGEYWMHTQDVALPNGVPQPVMDDLLEKALAKRVQVAARQLHWRTRGLVFERPDGRRRAITPGGPRRVVTGDVANLVLWTYGRPNHATTRNADPT